MNAPERTSNPVLKSLKLAAGCFAALTAVLPLFIAYGYSTYGSAGLQSAVIAYGICLSAGVAALLIAGALNSPKVAVAGVLASMVFRLGLPMAALVTFQANQHPLLEAGVDGMILVYYLLMLAVEAPLSLLLVRPNPTPTGVS